MTTAVLDRRVAKEPTVQLHPPKEAASPSQREYLVADLFCGAGGTSTGASKAVADIGGRINMVAINHWKTAVKTHSLNHPAARHYVQDLDGADPEAIVPEGWLDLLMASPECRFFSRARGGKPMHEQGRMNPWIIHRWLTSLNVNCLLVENVPEFTSWGPLNDEGRPDKSRKGIYFDEWVRSIRGIGYDVEWRILNAADFGDATSRVRFFLQARRDGQPIRWPQPSHSKTGGGDLLDDLPKWRGAREIIDWSNTGRSLLDDPKYKRRPLSVNTRKRIARGLQRFGGPLAPYYVRLLDLDDDSLPAAERQSAAPDVRPWHGSDRQNTAPRDMEEPIPTITTWGHGGCYMVQPVATPFLLGQQSAAAPRNTTEPVPTIAGAGAIAMIKPMIVEYYGNGVARTVSEPLPTVTTKARHALAQPTVVPVDSQDGGSGVHACLIPNFGERGSQAPRVHDIDSPTPAVTSRGAGSLLTPTISEATGPTEELDPRRLVLIDGQVHVLDIRYRMLQNPELARAMGFSDDEQEYEFVGNIGQVTKQIGNAVPVNLAAALVKAVLGPASETDDKDLAQAVA